MKFILMICILFSEILYSAENVWNIDCQKISYDCKIGNVTIEKNDNQLKSIVITSGNNKFDVPVAALNNIQNPLLHKSQILFSNNRIINSVEDLREDELIIICIEYGDEKLYSFTNPKNNKIEDIVVYSRCFFIFSKGGFARRDRFEIKKNNQWQIFTLEDNKEIDGGDEEFDLKELMTYIPASIITN